MICNISCRTRASYKTSHSSLCGGVGGDIERPKGRNNIDNSKYNYTEVLPSWTIHLSMETVAYDRVALQGMYVERQTIIFGMLCCPIRPESVCKRFYTRIGVGQGVHVGRNNIFQHKIKA